MPVTLIPTRMGPSTLGRRFCPPKSCFLLLALLRFSVCWTGTSALRELIPPRPLPPLISTPPPLFAGPPVHPTTVTVPPVFQQENNTELHSQVGTTAVLHCPTEHVGENTMILLWSAANLSDRKWIHSKSDYLKCYYFRQVSWVRRRDYHLLTVGLIVYSSDQRFSVRYINNDKVTDLMDWQLHIRYVQKRDEGVYECQIATHPPISLLSTLHVVEATSEILGGPEKYMTTGSSLRLVCVLRKNTQPPSYVFWYHGDRMINYDTKVKVDTGGEVSVLFLGEVGPQSTGNYSCVPSNAQSSHIHVHVLRGGETPAAIHSGSAASLQTFSWLHSADSLHSLPKWLATCLVMIRNYSLFPPRSQLNLKYVSSDLTAESNKGFNKYCVDTRSPLFESSVNSTLPESTIHPTAKHMYRGYIAKPLQPIFLDNIPHDSQTDPLLAYFIFGATPAALLSVVIVCLHYFIICKVLLQVNSQRTEYRGKEISRPQTRDGFDYRKGSRASSCVTSKHEVSYNEIKIINCKRHEISDLPMKVLLADSQKNQNFKNPTARPPAENSWKHPLSEYVECSIHPLASEYMRVHISRDAEARFRPGRCTRASNESAEQSQ